MAKTYDEIMELIGKTAELTKDNSESTAIVLKQGHRNPTGFRRWVKAVNKQRI